MRVRRHIPSIVKRNVIEAHRLAAGHLSIAAIARAYRVSRQSAHQWINGASLREPGRQPQVDTHHELCLSLSDEHGPCDCRDDTQSEVTQ